MLDRFLHLDHVDAADHVFELAEAELRHHLANLFGNEEEVVDDVLRSAFELRAKCRILRRNSDRARIQVALAHHDAAHRHSGAVEKPNSSAPSRRRDNHVTSGLQLAVGLHDDAAAQIVHHENLLCFGETEFPRNSRVLQRCERRGARAAVVAADQYDIGVGLCDTGRNRTDADLGHQLHRNPRLPD